MLCCCNNPFPPWGPLKFYLIQSNLTVKKWDTLRTNREKGRGEDEEKEVVVVVGEAGEC